MTGSLQLRPFHLPLLNASCRVHSCGVGRSTPSVSMQLAATSFWSIRDVTQAREWFCRARILDAISKTNDALRSGALDQQWVLILWTWQVAENSAKNFQARRLATIEPC